MLLRGKRRQERRLGQRQRVVTVTELGIKTICDMWPRCRAWYVVALLAKLTTFAMLSLERWGSRLAINGRFLYVTGTIAHFTMQVLKEIGGSVTELTQ